MGNMIRSDNIQGIRRVALTDMKGRTRYTAGIGHRGRYKTCKVGYEPGPDE